MKKIAITNPDKILFPKGKGASRSFTKGDLIAYYQKIAPRMISHIKNRPLTMLRYPNGITREGFYQKDAADYFPSWIAIQPVKKSEGGVVDYVLANNVDTLGYLANLACITPHVWLSRADKIHYPDRMIFDLDPGKGVDFAMVRWAAFILKDFLEDLGLKPFVMTTGSRGVHVVVPLKRVHEFDEVRAFAHEVARVLVKKYPKKLTLEMRKAKRGKRIFVDYLRNAWSATSVAPYAVRPKPGAPVATPITWQELKKVSSQSYNVTNIFALLSKRADVWKKINASACTLASARKKLKMITDL